MVGPLSRSDQVISFLQDAIELFKAPYGGFVHIDECIVKLKDVINVLELISDFCHKYPPKDK